MNGLLTIRYNERLLLVGAALCMEHDTAAVSAEGVKYASDRQQTARGLF